MNLSPYINWMQRFTIYETSDEVLIVGSDSTEKLFRIMSISRLPDNTHNEPTLSAETQYDIAWRLKISEDSRNYSGHELTDFLQSVKARSPVKRSPPSDTSHVFQNEEMADPSHSFVSRQPLNKTLTGVALIGFIRFLFGYYLIVVTQHREVARIGEHKIYMIDDIKMVYIPISAPISLTSVDDSRNGRHSMQADESKFLKMFQGVELNRDFYFSYTYDLTKSLQVNMEPLGIMGTRFGPFGKLTAFQSTPDARFLWNYSLIPPKFQPTSENGSNNWFVSLMHGFVRQASIVSCGMPVSIILLARRSRYFAGTRFLKRGANIDGNVANEVETEQIVCDTSEPILSRMRVSSMVQHRGSVPLFWSQDTAKLMVGKPPLAITWQDPYYEAFGMHFADLIERHGTPVIVLNLMKQQEKRPFEQQLTAGFLEGIEHLNQYAPKVDASISLNGDGRIFTPIAYVGFDMARIKRSTDPIAMDNLLETAEKCIRSTGIFFSAGIQPVSDVISRMDYIQRTREMIRTDICPRQHGIVRTNCVDCLDRTNTAQFVLGHAAIAYQLRALGILANTKLAFDSKVSKVLRDLFSEHGDTLALQYGGSGVVHNIETYQNPSTSRVNSRDIMQTLSRYYSNNFIDFEKQLATDLFLRIFRPGAGPRDCEWSFDPVAIAATSSAQAGLAFLLTSDPAFEAYMHWLHAWASIPPYREPLDSWFPEKAFNERQNSLRGWDNSKCPILVEDIASTDHFLKDFRLIELKDDDPGGDWYSELYRPHDWTHFYDLKYHQLPLVMSSKTETSSLHTRRASVNIPLVASRLHFQSRLPTFLSSMVLTAPDENEERCGLFNHFANNQPATNRTITEEKSINQPDSNPIFPDSLSNVTETPSTVSRIFQMRAEDANKTSKPVQPDGNLGPTESSIEALLHFRQIESDLNSPLHVRFSQIRLSDLANRAEMKKKEREAPQSVDSSDDLEDFSTSVNHRLRKSPSPRNHRPFDISSRNAPVKIRKPSKRDMEKYKKFASVPILNVCTPLSEVLTIDPASMKIYENTIDLAQKGVFSIPNESLRMYQKIVDAKKLYEL